MEEIKDNCKCPDCERRAREDAENEEVGLAFLVALMPLLAVTLFSNMGLF